MAIHNSRNSVITDNFNNSLNQNSETYKIHRLFIKNNTRKNRLELTLVQKWLNKDMKLERNH